MRVNVSLPDNLIKELDEYCEKYKDDRSGVLAEAVRGLLYFRLKTGTMPIENEMARSSTVERGTVNPQATGPSPVVPARIPQNAQNSAQINGKVYDELWEDHNWLPVKKERLEPAYCKTFHSAGERRPLYDVCVYRADGSVGEKGLFCRECVKKFVAEAKATGGHLE